MPITAVWILGLVASILYGVAIGSFLNVVIYRLPRGQSVASPVWSYCPNCKHRLSPADLIPLLSFLILGRKCRYCHQPISWRYFGVEALTGLLFTLVYLRYGWATDVVFDDLFACLLVSIFFIDLEYFIIPDELSILGFALGVVYNFIRLPNVHDTFLRGDNGSWSLLPGTGIHVPSSIVSAVICAAIFHLISLLGLIYYASSLRKGRLGKALGSFLFGIVDDYAYLLVKFLGFGLWLPSAKKYIHAHEIYHDAQSDGGSTEFADTNKSHDQIAIELENDEEQTGMGQGDAKLALMIGSYLLLPISLLSFFIAIIAGTIGGVAVMIAKGRGGRTAIPFGPYLAVGAYIALLYGHQLLAWYANYVFGKP